MYESCTWGRNMQLITIYALTVKICIYMHYKSWQNQLLLCNSFAPKFSDRYIEPAEYAIYAKFKALVTNHWFNFFFVFIVNSFCECEKFLRICALFVTKAENCNKEMLCVGTCVFKIKSAKIKSDIFPHSHHF